jgi:DNA-binding transcriptional LysR family regulator
METNVYYRPDNGLLSADTMRNLDTGLVRAFVAVAETSGMTAAGHVLHLTQAAVSQQIKRLEESLGQTLFERDRKGLRLTEAGERLFGKAKRLLALNDEIWSEMSAAPQTGTLRLGIPYDLVSLYLPPVLKSFAQAHPGVEVSLCCRSSPTLRDLLSAGEVDLAVLEERSAGPGAETLATEHLVWVGARGGEAHRRRPLRVSFGSDTCAFRATIFEALTEAEIPWRLVAEIDSIDAVTATVSTDLSVTALLAPTVPDGLEALGPGSGLPTLPPFAINLYLPRTASVAAQALAARLRSAFVGRPRRDAA